MAKSRPCHALVRGCLICLLSFISLHCQEIAPLSNRLFLGFFFLLVLLFCSELFSAIFPTTLYCSTASFVCRKHFFCHLYSRAMFAKEHTCCFSHSSVEGSKIYFVSPMIISGVNISLSLREKLQWFRVFNPRCKIFFRGRISVVEVKAC